MKKGKFDYTMRSLRLGGILMGLFTVWCLTACIKEEPKNTECDIVSAWVEEGSQYDDLFYQKTNMHTGELASTVHDIIFTVRLGSLKTLPKMPIHFAITPGATISPANGSLQDFSKGPVTYTVTSEDGAWQRQYKVAFTEPDLPSFKFSFENVDEEKQGSSSYHVFYEKDQSGIRHNVWASGNQGVAIAQYKWQSDQFPTKMVANGYKGNCVCLNTQYAGDLGKAMKKPIAAGNLFLGQFNLNMVLVNTLKATEFGIPVDFEPMRVKGYYKYRPGETFTNMKLEEVPGRTDEASIYAVYYRNEDAEGNKIILHGDDVLSSQYIVSKAEMKTLPPTDEWTYFEMDFEGAKPDPKLMKNMGYNLTVVFSSSKDGAAFEGAIGSELYVDEVEVLYTKEAEIVNSEQQ